MATLQFINRFADSIQSGLNRNDVFSSNYRCLNDCSQKAAIVCNGPGNWALFFSCKHLGFAQKCQPSYISWPLALVFTKWHFKKGCHEWISSEMCVPKRTLGSWHSPTPYPQEVKLMGKETQFYYQSRTCNKMTLSVPMIL